MIESAAPRRHTLRAMVDADLPVAHRLSTAVGWPHRLADWRFALDHGAGLVACIDGGVVGTAMWWVFEGRVARLGLVIVDPTLQKAGIGKSLMNAALGSIEAETIVLNATDAGAPLYRRLGFERVGGIMQYQGLARVSADVVLPPGQRIRPLAAADVDGLIALDAGAIGTERDALLRRMLGQYEVVVLEADGHVAGFAIYREFGRGGLAGPVVAADRTQAKALIQHWIARRPGAFLRVDADDEGGLGRWLAAAGMLPIAPAITMARGARPILGRGANTYCLVTQALG